MEKRGEFPRRFTIGQSKVAWDLAEVDAWIAARRARDQQVPANARRSIRQARG